jgi:hypothetical protein
MGLELGFLVGAYTSTKFLIYIENSRVRLLDTSGLLSLHEHISDTPQVPKAHFSYLVITKGMLDYFRTTSAIS